MVAAVGEREEERKEIRRFRALSGAELRLLLDRRVAEKARECQHKACFAAIHSSCIAQ